jgi:hypothetical protein
MMTATIKIEIKDFPDRRCFRVSGKIVDDTPSGKSEKFFEFSPLEYIPNNGPLLDRYGLSRVRNKAMAEIREFVEKHVLTLKAR